MQASTDLAFGAPGGIRTPGPQIRSLVLYPAELRARMPLFENPSSVVNQQLAEREGFEPSMGAAHTPLAGERLQPLGHLSKGQYKLTLFEFPN